MHLIGLVASSILAIGFLAHGGEKTVTVATLDDYSPFCFPKEGAKADEKAIAPGTDSVRLQGYSWDVLRESLHAMGYAVELQVTPWARAMKYVKDGRVDLIFPAGRNAEREKIFLYSEEPVNKVNFLIYVCRDTEIRWQDLSSLASMRIGAVRGWNYGEAWQVDTSIDKQYVDKISLGFKMLLGERLDGFAGYEIIFDYTLKQERMEGKFKKLPSFGSTSEHVVGLKNERVRQLLADFDAGKRKIVAAGTFARINARWR